MIVLGVAMRVEVRRRDGRLFAVSTKPSRSSTSCPASATGLLHDLRRTMRSRLSALPIEETVREAMIAHRPAGVKGVYNVYQYDNEKRRGYELYEAALSQVLLPTKLSAVSYTPHVALVQGI